MATKHAWLIPIVFSLAACDGARTVVSDELTEEAKVVQVIYQPSQTSSSSGTSVDLDLKVKFHNHTITSPDKFSVVFECQHGKFVIEDEGKGSRAERLWKKLSQGDKVNVRYKEVKTVWPDGRSELQKYEFVEAEKVVDVEKGGSNGR